MVVVTTTPAAAEGMDDSSGGSHSYVEAEGRKLAQGAMRERQQRVRGTGVAGTGAVGEALAAAAAATGGGASGVCTACGALHQGMQWRWRDKVASDSRQKG